MIWGETTAAFNLRITAWHPWFAWHPIQLEDGRMAWLCQVERQWRVDECANWAGDSSRWVYRAHG